jgi:hypothetical protein
MDVLELLELFILFEEEEGLFLYLLLLEWELRIPILFDYSIAFYFSSSDT